MSNASIVNNRFIIYFLLTKTSNINDKILAMDYVLEVLNFFLLHDD